MADISDHDDRFKGNAKTAPIDYRGNPGFEGCIGIIHDLEPVPGTADHYRFRLVSPEAEYTVVGATATVQQMKAASGQEWLIFGRANRTKFGQQVIDLESPTVVTRRIRQSKDRVKYLINRNRACQFFFRWETANADRTTLFLEEELDRLLELKKNSRKPLQG